MLRTPALLQCLLRNTKNGEEPRRELAARKTLASLCKALPASLLLISQLSGLATPACGSTRRPARRRTTACYQFDALGGAAHFTALSMPEKYDDEDEVGTGLYILIGCAAVTVVLMYSWIGYTLYQGFKARRKVD